MLTGEEDNEKDNAASKLKKLFHRRKTVFSRHDYSSEGRG